MDEPEDLNSLQMEILEMVSDTTQEGTKLIQSTVCDSLNKDKGYISTTLKEMEQNNLLRRQKKGRSKEIEITDKGCRILLQSRSSTPEENNSLFHLHKFTVRFPVQNKEIVEERRGEDWREKFIENTEYETIPDPNNDSEIIKHSLWQFRITRDAVIVTIDSLSGHDPTLLKTRAIARARKAAKWIEGEASISLLRNDYTKVVAEVTNQHLALIGDPLSELVNNEEHPDAQLFLKDENGNTRVWTDNSDGRDDLEAGTGFGAHGFGEQDIETFKFFYQWMLQNEKAFRNLLNWAEEEFA